MDGLPDAGPPPEDGEGIGEWDVEGFTEPGRICREPLLGTRDLEPNRAHVLRTYESRVGSEESDPVGRGVDSVQLLRYDGRCWIAAIAFDVELPDSGIPDRYVGAADG